jgi:methionyl-tRNA synthetase
MQPFYITTPIYYVNDRPHIGTAYSTIAADVISRYQRLRGRPTRFVTGLDEHGLKLARAASDAGLEPQAFVDGMAGAFVDAWKLLGCDYDDFIRTTEPRHKDRARYLWKRIAERGDIYLGDYEDWYCVGCETFYTEKDLLEGKICPQHKRPVERIKESSYFFKLAAYGERLLAFYEANPKFVQPEGRFNEVKSFVREGLRDLSLSRTTFTWGVPVPDDDKHVMYVWFDALTNYLSALSGPAEPGEAPLFDQFWPPSGEAMHLVGKDILRFHAVYWPAFLLSAGLQPPTQIWAHGWLTVSGEKMSKSLGNAVAPEALVECFGADVLRYYLMRDVALGQDGDFSHASLFARYNGELGNGLGNLLQRIVSSIVKNNLGGRVPAVAEATTAEDRELLETAARCARAAAAHMDAIAPQRALDAIWELVGAANLYVDRTKPWALVKSGDQARLAQVAYTVLECLRWLSVMVWPVMPQKAGELRAQLGLPPLVPVVGADQWPALWGELPAGLETRPAETLFPRIDKDGEARILARLGVVSASAGAGAGAGAGEASTRTSTSTSTSTGTGTGTSGVVPPPAVKETIQYDDFAKIDLRVGLVKTAERVPKSKKLLRLEIDLGESVLRQVLAGIGEHYAPEDMVGRRVVVVANLAPRPMMGLVSHGMVLAANDGSGRLVLSSVAGEPPPGSTVA